jgi:hypothetical protein
MEMKPKAALGRYLEKPVLHYSIGTHVKPSVVKELEHFGIGNVTVHDEPAPFEPEMIRAAANLTHEPDWMAGLLGSQLKKTLLRGAHRGLVSDESGTSFVPGLARAKDFGRSGPVKSWQPSEVVKVP